MLRLDMGFWGWIPGEINKQKQPLDILGAIQTQAALPDLTTHTPAESPWQGATRQNWNTIRKILGNITVSGVAAFAEVKTIVPQRLAPVIPIPEQAPPSVLETNAELEDEEAAS